MVKMTREKLLGLSSVIEKLSMEKIGVKFHFLLLKTKRLIAPEVESLQKLMENSPEFIEYQKKRVTICESYCEKKDDGKPKEINNNYVIPSDTKEEFEKEIQKLQEEYPNVIPEYNKKQEELSQLLKEDVEVNCPSIPFSVLPDTIVGMELEMLFDLIDEDA